MNIKKIEWWLPFLTLTSCSIGCLIGYKLSLNPEFNLTLSFFLCFCSFIFGLFLSWYIQNEARR